MAKQVLTLATAGLPPGFSESNRFPRIDYLVLLRVLNTDILNYDIYNRSWLGRCLRHLETQLVDAILLLLRDEERRQALAQAGQSAVQACYTWEQIAQTLLRLYGRL